MNLSIKIILFFIILGPVPASPLGQFLDTIQIACIFLIIIFALRRKSYLKNKNIKKDLRFLFAFFVYAIGVSFPFSLIIINGNFSGEYINSMIRPLRILITFFGVWATITLYYRQNQKSLFDNICLDITRIVVLNGVIMFLQLFIPSFQTFLNNVLFNNISAIHFQDVNRVGGLYLSGGAVPSMFQAIPLLIIPYLFKQKKIKFITAISWYLILTGSIIITGRSGLLLIPFSVLIMLNNSSFPKKIALTTLAIALIMMLPLLLQNIYGWVQSTGNQKLSFNYDRLLTLTSINPNNPNSDQTIAVILSKISLPDSVSQLLFGNVNFSNYLYTDVSDMGFNIILFKFGIIGFVLYYLSFFYMIFCIFRFKYLDKTASFFLKVTFLAYILLEFKEEVMYARNGYSIMLLLFFAAAISERQNLKKKNKSLVQDKNIVAMATDYTNSHKFLRNSGIHKTT